MNAVATKEPTVSLIPEMNLKGKLIADVIISAMQAQFHTGLCIFAEYLGHVDTLSLSVRKSQAEYEKELMTGSIRLVPYDFCDDLQKKTFETNILLTLEAVKDQLDKLASSGDLDTEAFRQIDLFTMR